MQESAIYQEIYHSGELRGELKGELKGKLKGKLETQIKIALNLLQKGLKISEIAEVTELSLDLLESLIKNQSNNN